MATPMRTLGCSPRPEWADGEYLPVGLAEDLKAVCGSVSEIMPMRTSMGSSSISAVKCSISVRASSRLTRQSGRSRVAREDVRPPKSCSQASDGSFCQ